ncbi:MAG: ABC transporter ATP-binding protein [Clostridium sp.]|uniref:ABC transporter ATP-binding protein n=1 Tax=Clostridium sp. TaxID=1506 RepID=UPI002A91AB82|nr:ABC transporter ATP-binding protein [Clostridium sp.]MCI7083444.1 ABC transporter ATP-binding protein [Mycoplasmatota bacterium]MDY6226852.1 ABC transporter ATP-binding protein [Clostridium sp.]
MSLINLKNLSKYYTNGNDKFYALNNINLTINKGEMIAVMGPSGAGKTTLLHIIGAIDNFNDGDYFLMNKSIKDITDIELSKFRNKTFGFIFQYFALLKDYTAIENVKVPLNYRKISKKEKNEKSIKYLEYVGLKNHMDKLPKEMSGGQQQRVAIARALAQETDIILADEPTGALDQNTSKEIMQILKSINELGKTIIIITHDNNIASYCNRIINIEDGKIIYDSN